MPNQYNTTVFANGQVIRWRMRDADCNRFKVCLTPAQSEYIDADQFDPDDCWGEDFVTICRLISEIDPEGLGNGA